MELHAHGKHIFVSEVVQDKGTEIILPTNVASGKGLSAEVMIAEIQSIGEDVGYFDFNSVKQVLVPAYAGIDFAMDGVHYKIIQEHEILAIEYKEEESTEA